MSQDNTFEIPPGKRLESTGYKKDSILTRNDSSTENLENSRFGKPFSGSENVVFQVGGRQVHVSRAIVCANSPVFDAMLNGDFSEKNKAIIPLADDSYDDFIDLMTIVHPPLQAFVFTSDNIEGLVHLADKYQMSFVLKLCEDYFLAHMKLTVEHLVLAQKYKLNSYMTHCIADLCKTMTKREIMSDQNGLFVTTKIEVIKARVLLLERFYNQKTCYRENKIMRSYNTKSATRNLQNVQKTFFKPTAKKQFQTTISSISTRPLLTFSEPWPTDDVIVQVQGRQIHACKPPLYHNSTVLKHMLYHAVNDEIHIDDDDVTCDDFIVLMNIIHPPMKLDALTGSNVTAVACLANKYKMRGVVDLCEQFMLQHHTDYTYQTLLTAQQCHMTELLQYCTDILSKYHTVDEMMKCIEFTSFDDNTVLILFGKRLERLENVFAENTLYDFEGNEYNITNWHTYI